MRQDFLIRPCSRLHSYLLLLTLALTSAANAADLAQGKILIINSDSQVEKYRQTEQEFRHELNSKPIQILSSNLDKINAPEDLETLIQNEQPDLVYSIGSKAYQLADQAKINKPLLFSSVINWQRFSQNANTHGIANELSLSQELSLMRYLLPGALRIGVLYDPRFSKERISEARSYAQELGITLVEQAIDDSARVAPTLTSMLPNIDLLWLIADPGVLNDKTTIEQIFRLCEQAHKPIYAYSDAFLAYGASLVVVADIPTIGRQVANLAESILRKETIAKSVQSPAGSHIILNQCQLAKIQAQVNQDALDSVNRIVECQ